jgi:hypothetical protein
MPNSPVEQGFRAARGERRFEREFEDGTGYVEIFTDGRPWGPEKAQVSANVSFRSRLLARAFDIEPPRILEAPGVQWKRWVGNLGESSPPSYWTVTAEDPTTIERCWIAYVLSPCLRLFITPRIALFETGYLRSPRRAASRTGQCRRPTLLSCSPPTARLTCFPTSKPGSGGSGTPAARTARRRSASSNASADARQRSTDEQGMTPCTMKPCLPPEAHIPLPGGE